MIFKVPSNPHHPVILWFCVSRALISQNWPAWGHTTSCCIHTMTHGGRLYNSHSWWYRCCVGIANDAGGGGEKQRMLLFGRIYCSDTSERAWDACMTKQGAVLIGENSKFLTCIFVNVSVNLKQKKVLAFWNKLLLNSLYFKVICWHFSLPAEVFIYCQIISWFSLASYYSLLRSWSIHYIFYVSQKGITKFN